jgi:hypothetical protein
MATASDEVIALLAKSHGRLELGLDSLAVAAATALGHRTEGVGLPRVVEIEANAVTELSRCQGELALHLTRLRPECAKALASHKGGLDLNAWGLRSPHNHSFLRLDLRTAREIAGIEGELKLWFMDINQFDGDPSDIVKALAAHSGRLELSFGIPLSPPMAKHLSTHSDHLMIRLHQPLEESAADELARHSGVLEVSSVPRFSRSVVKALARHQGKSLILRGLTSLDESTALSLARYSGSLSITDVEAASGDTIAALSTHRGLLRISSALVRVDTVDHLVRHDGGLEVYGPTSPSLPEEVVRRLAGYDGYLRIDVRLSDDSAVALKQHEGDLALGDLPASEAAADALLARSGRLLFPDSAFPRSLAGARLLASDKTITGVVTSECLVGPDAEAIAAVLARRRGLLALPNLRYVSVDAIRALATKGDARLPPLDSLYIVDDDGRDVSPADLVSDHFLKMNAENQPPPKMPKWHSLDRLLKADAKEKASPK